MKKTVSIILALALMCCIIPTAFAASSEATEAADTLNALGLFSGTGTDANGKPIYELDRAPSRAEAITMLVRLLGKEDEAKAGTWEIPFTDVQDWAKPYVGYAYANKLTSGTSPTTFGGSATMTATQYITLVLRALGYQSGPDFQWDNAWELSDKIGMTDGRYNASATKFTRGDVSLISKTALSVCEKGGDTTLASQLLDNGAIDMGAALLAGLVPETKALQHTIVANEYDFFHMDFSEIVALVPDTKYACSILLEKNYAPKSIDELIASSEHMANLLCNETPGRYNFDFSRYAMEKMLPVTLLFSDENTLCGYVVSRPARLDDQHFGVEFVLCNYSFSELTKTVRAEYKGVELSPVQIGTETIADIASFLPYSQTSDKLYVESNIDTILCNLWLQYRSLIKYKIVVGGYETLPISEFESFTKAELKNWQNNSYVGTMSFVYLLVNSNNIPVGYTTVDMDSSTQN